ncbi:MAG TPA: ABC transporter permease [Burkholderiales bacterium]|jgi:peptide/nickel transport system permease protein
MTGYVIRRLAYGVLVLIGVNLFTFWLFFKVNTPDDIARIQLGGKRITADQIVKWKAEHGYDKPLLYNGKASGSAQFTDTIYFQKSASMFALDFGQSDDGRDIWYEIRTRAGPSLVLALPTFVVGLAVQVSFALLLALFRGTRFDFTTQVLLVVLMSVSTLFYIIGGQYLFSKLWRLVPISGYDTLFDSYRFVVLPVVIGVIAGISGSTRLYRTIFVEEVGRDYVRTARAKGLSELTVMFRHVLKNGMIPILTGVVAVIPMLFMGSLLFESFFGIPGLGNYLIDAIQAQDFGIVRSMVFIGTVLLVFGLIATDISYTFVDPRVRLE